MALQSIIPLLGSDDYPYMNWKETQNSHIFEFDAASLTKDQVKLELHQGRVLRISGERSTEEEKEEEGITWHLKERTRGYAFSREFQLPDIANVDDIKASMRDGLLVVTVAKENHGGFDLNIRNRHRQVEISSSEGHDPKGLIRFLYYKVL